MVELFVVGTVGSGVLLELDGRRSLARGRSRVPDLREPGVTKMQYWKEVLPQD